MKEDDVRINLIDDAKLRRDTSIIENEMSHFKEEHEGEMILNDIRLLEEMGYEKKMINKIYILLQPENIERAIDYLTEIDGIYQHNFFESNNKSKDNGLCFICKKSKRFHLDYIPDDLIENNQNKFEQDILIENKNNNNNDNSNNSLNNEIKIENNTKTCQVCYEDVEGDDESGNNESEDNEDD